MQNLIRDLRYSLRMMGRAPGFTALAIATLALGIGANTAIFTIANSVLLRPLAYNHPEELVRISTKRDGSGWVSLPYFTQLSDANRSFAGVAAYQFETANLERPDGAEQIDAERVTGNFFDVLAAQPIAGRAFTPDEDQPGSNPVVLISYELAARLFGDEQKALNQHLALNSKHYTVIGVLPPKFGVRLLARRPDVWMTRPIDLSLVTPARVNRGGMYYEAVGRLRPGVSSAQARAETDVIFQQYKLDQPGNFDAQSDVAMTVLDLRANLVANVRPTLLILSAAVGFVLMIACANVAGLLLFRALGRRMEFAVRSALGAPRRVLIRQLLTESVLMAVASGALGVAVGYAGTRLLAKFTAINLPQAADVPVDLRVLAFTLAISMFSGLLFGLAPALQLSRADLGATLADEGRGSAGNRERHRARAVVVTAQVALSMVLLVGAGLLIRSFLRLRGVDPGFNPRHTLTAKTFLPPTTYADNTQRIAFYQAALEHLASIPGVESVSISTALPILPTHQSVARFEGEPEVDLGRRPIVMIESVSPDYAKALGVPLMAGRAFDNGDTADAAQVVMVNRATVRRFWPNDNPIGKLVWIGTLPPRRVVGVLADTRNDSLSTPTQPEVFFPFPQFPYPVLYFTLRTAGDARAVTSALREQVEAVHRGQPVTDVQTMDERLESGSAPTRSVMLLISVFSATALILALVGIYGVIAYSVAQRTKEFAIRVAVGASQADILKLVVENGLRLAMAGIAIGLVASFALTRLMGTLLFETSATDPLTFLACAAMFAAVAVLASCIPARRAMRISPTAALRSS